MEIAADTTFKHYENKKKQKQVITFSQNILKIF